MNTLTRGSVWNIIPKGKGFEPSQRALTTLFLAARTRPTAFSQLFEKVVTRIPALINRLSIILIAFGKILLSVPVSANAVPIEVL